MMDYFHEHNLRGVITPKSLIMLRANSQQTYVFVIPLKNAASGFYNRVSTCDLRFTMLYVMHISGIAYCSPVKFVASCHYGSSIAVLHSLMKIMKKEPAIAKE